MHSHGRSAVAPLYLFACLLLGGSAQGIWQNAVLQLGGIVLIAWAAATGTPEPMPRRAKALLLLAIAAIAIVALQLVPLPHLCGPSSAARVSPKAISCLASRSLDFLCRSPPRPR